MVCHLVVGSYGASPEKRTGVIGIYFLTAIGLTPSGSSTVHIYTQTVHRITQLLEGFLGFEPRVVKLKLTMN